jgi:hypothetical protein
MADEITFSLGFSIRKGNLDEEGRPNRFTLTMTGTKGPTPGSILVPTTGIVDLSALDTPGACWVHNTDDTNFVTMGIYDGTRFYPLLKFPPDAAYPVILSNYLNQEFVGTGTGTNADINYLMLIADTAACQVIVKAYSA